jgi:hypothetical protein
VFERRPAKKPSGTPTMTAMSTDQKPSHSVRGRKSRMSALTFDP